MDGILTSMGLFGDKKASAAPAATLKGAPPSNATEETFQGDQSSAVINRTPTMKSRTTSSTSAVPSNTDGEPPHDVSLSEELSPSAVIGSKINFKGELSGDEDLLIQGKVEGTVTLKGHKLTVGKLGYVKANLQAKNIIIDGTVEGDILADEHIAINASSIVKGNIIAERVTLEDGAKFRGSIDMDTDAAPKEPLKPLASKIDNKEGE